MSINCWIGEGRLSKGVDLRYTPSGKAYGRVLMAVDRYGKDGKKGTDWIRLVLWGRTAETCGRLLGKGSRVLVQGRISAEFWEREVDGVTKAQLTTEVVVEQIDFLGPPTQKRSEGGNSQAAEQSSRGGTAA